MCSLSSSCFHEVLKFLIGFFLVEFRSRPRYAMLEAVLAQILLALAYMCQRLLLRSHSGNSLRKNFAYLGFTKVTKEGRKAETASVGSIDPVSQIWLCLKVLS